ncbi:multiple epidermal growth factor-like domains protein 9 isoform X1 [Hypanus sabinus]|uniref:multiple epidermal growth factor-like domains protein 9 isoform X1 n=1 Tax=Hypanus sabinus TaxID=79690 RepID=UPI0028C3CEDD|nr:multiple epidermal growth factor-like domains protein 9 isoform X1 [Hypanus sabinus]
MRLQGADCGQQWTAGLRPGSMRPPAPGLALVVLCLAWPVHTAGTVGWNGTEGSGSTYSTPGTAGRLLSSSTSTTGQLLPISTSATGQQLPTSTSTTGQQLPTSTSTTGQLLPTSTSTTGQLLPTAAAAAANPNSTEGQPLPSAGWPDEAMPELRCNCSIVGSTNGTCNVSLGQCDCLPGYAGMQCSICAEGFYRNINGQCTRCECHTTGAESSQCDSMGKCHCKPGVTGPKCSQCQPLHYQLNDTGCKPCQCNNLSLMCDSRAGVCLNCTGNTEGVNCERCKESYYRKPQANSTSACERCPCSVVTSSGSCHLESGEPVCDRCQPGYFGAHCEECADGYYNSDSICVRCECNKNIDAESRLPICDSESGRCLSCTTNTTGFHCEKCAEGYRGDAVAGTCQKEITTVLPTTSTEPSTSLSPTTTPVTNSTMAPSDQTLLPVLLTTTQGGVSTVAPVAPEISWTRFNLVVLVVIITVVVLLMGFVAAVYVYREYRNRKLNAPFWTIELKEDNISFSSYHDSIPNADVSGLLEDDANEVVPNGQLTLSTPMSSYKI